MTCASAGCNITLIPKIGPIGFLWDTGKFKPIAEAGMAVDYNCVDPLVPGGRGSGGLESAGDNGNLMIVLFAQNSEFAKRIEATPKDASVELGEAEANDSEDTEDDDDFFRQPKRQKFSPEEAPPNQAPLGPNADTLSSSIGSGWALQFNGFKFFGDSVAAQHLVKFYDGVVDEASRLLETATPLVKQHAFTAGGISLVLVGTDVIYWDWVITFAMAMADSTGENAPMQFASTIASQWQQNTIKAELFLGGKGIF
ncbi:MAG: hypothetical protein Q9168_007329 [Polycauliona sp. 1 TL-2023]